VRRAIARYDDIARARSVPIADVLVSRGHNLQRCGGELVGPCPVCGGRDRFAVNPRKQVWNCRGCGKGGDVIELVRHLDGCEFNAAVELLTGEKGAAFDRAAARPDPARPAKEKAEAAEYERRQHEKAAWLWSQRQPINGTIAEKYLHGRGITCLLPPTLGFLPPWKSQHSPAMIAAFALSDEIEPGVLAPPRAVKAVHLTLLKPDGSGKADVERPKRIVGSPGMLPIVLAPVSDLGGLAIVEGIEDALSVHEATELGAWAAGSAGHMPPLANVIPYYVETVTIFAHHDKAGQNGARGLAKQLRDVDVFIEGLRDG
jgi:putative DNA primase/helicase